MSRFYVRPEDVKGDEIFVSSEEAHHIIDVMRLGVGDEIVAFDGRGNEYAGKISGVGRTNLTIKIKKIIEVKEKKKIHITLAQALPKKAKMDFIVEKATELGVDEIIPLATERTIVHLDEGRREDKLRHWQNIAINASKQCGRQTVPEVRPVIKFKDLLKKASDYDLLMMACLSENTEPFKKIIASFKGKKVLAMIGPEGDFSPKEIASVKAAGAKLVSLGRLVLRVDTASIFILSVLSAFASE